MTQIVTRAGFVPDTFDAQGITLDLEALQSGTRRPAGAPLAVRLEVDTDPAELVPHFDDLEMIVLHFDKSADGRGFSLARQLRQLGYAKTIRAEGHILVDQFRAAIRVGIDELAIDDAQAARNPEPQWLAVPLGAGYRDRLFAAG